MPILTRSPLRWGFSFKPLSNVSAFTYRDGATFLQKLEELVRKVLEIIGAVNDNTEAIEELQNEFIAYKKYVDLRFTQFEAQIRNELAALKQELEDEIAQATIGGTAENPTNGRIEAITKVISDLYDNVRVHAYFAVQLDEQDLTAAEIDATGRTARHFDLSPIDDTNDALVKE